MATSAWINVRDFPGDGDTAVRAAVRAARGVGGGAVYFPPGVHSITPPLDVPSNVNLVGAGRRATSIKRNGNGVLLSMSGPSTDATGATHVRYGGIQGLTLNGNGQTGPLIQAYYADNLVFRDVYFTSSDVHVDGVEFWDSRFLNCQFEASGGAADAILPSVHLRNSAATSGFGYSADNCNQIIFDGCRWEAFTNGALRIERGVNNGNNPNGIYVTNCKMESSQMRGGPHLYVSDACRAVWVNGLYCFAGNFTPGYSTPQNIIKWAAQDSTLENVLIANGPVPTINSAVAVFSGGGSTASLRNLVGRYGHPPLGAHVYFEPSSTADFNIQNVYANTGAQFGGAIPTRYAGHAPIRQVTGVPSDASFARTPLDGTLALDTIGRRLYARIDGTWSLV